MPMPYNNVLAVYSVCLPCCLAMRKKIHKKHTLISMWKVSEKSLKLPLLGFDSFLQQYSAVHALLHIFSGNRITPERLIRLS